MKEAIVFVGVGAGVVLGIGVLVAAMIEENRVWTQFKIDHDCVVVEKRASYTTFVPVYDPNLKSTRIQSVYHPSQTAWKCDDGVTYWR